MSDLGYEVTSHVGHFHGQMKKVFKRGGSTDYGRTSERSNLISTQDEEDASLDGNMLYKKTFLLVRLSFFSLIKFRLSIVNNHINKKNFTIFLKKVQPLIISFY